MQCMAYELIECVLTFTDYVWFKCYIIILYINSND